ncbi:hypothetical protein BT96DRAFT_942320 [Gymnopus androsaceus JB14]|uniref:Uncharacterized protein n=1 Tax=Gymnopus androsaceus JB14 TaxID=1447944 RepID=A0A6A4HES9_9AGAR|nr:hypothetical protein BT96DRAFT_942320 [Gymnopus androsaceus JB14]
MYCLVAENLRQDLAYIPNLGQQLGSFRLAFVVLSDPDALADAWLRKRAKKCGAHLNLTRVLRSEGIPPNLRPQIRVYPTPHPHANTFHLSSSSISSDSSRLHNILAKSCTPSLIRAQVWVEERSRSTILVHGIFMVESRQFSAGTTVQIRDGNHEVKEEEDGAGGNEHGSGVRNEVVRVKESSGWGGAEVWTLEVPPKLDLHSVETINIDQSQGAIIRSVKQGKIYYATGIAIWYDLSLMEDGMVSSVVMLNVLIKNMTLFLKIKQEIETNTHNDNVEMGDFLAWEQRLVLRRLCPGASVPV